MSQEQKIKQFMATHFSDRKDLSLEINVGYKWSNELQKRLDKLEYQVFTYKNQSCAPAETIEKALINAEQGMKAE